MAILFIVALFSLRINLCSGMVIGTIVRFDLYVCLADVYERRLNLKTLFSNSDTNKHVYFEVF